MEKINLFSYIVTKFLGKHYKYNGEYRTVIKLRTAHIYNYLIEENIKAIYGRCIFEPDEITDLVTTRDGLNIQDIFGINLKIEGFINPYGGSLVGTVNNKKVFEIIDNNNIITNRLIDKNEEQLRIYQIDLNKEEFTLYEGKVLDIVNPISEEDMEYIVKVNALDTKFGENDLFEVTYIKPADIKSDSLLKRLVDNLMTNNIIKIHTSSKAAEPTVYTDCIFEKLKESIKERRNIKTEDTSKGKEDKKLKKVKK